MWAFPMGNKKEEGNSNASVFLFYEQNIWPLVLPSDTVSSGRKRNV